MSQCGGDPVVDQTQWSFCRRMWMLFTAFVISAGTSGVTMGHNSLRTMMMANALHQQRLGYAVSPPQELRLMAMFTGALVLKNILTFPVGWILDRHGPRLVSVIGCWIFFAGCLVFALTDAHQHGLQFTGYMALTTGGMCMFVASLQLCRLMPHQPSFMLALLTSAFDMSAIVFYIFETIYNRHYDRISIRIMFGAYALFPVIAHFVFTTGYPEKPIKRDQPSPQLVPLWHPPAPAESGSHPSGLAEIVATRDFIYLTIYTALMILRFNFLIATLSSQLPTMNLDQDEMDSIEQGFKSLIAFGGFIGMSGIGELLCSWSLATNYLIVTLGMAVWGVLQNTLGIETQSAAIVLFVLLRPYFYSATNATCERLFGSGSFGGRAYGVLVSVVGPVNILIFLISYQVLQTRWLDFQLINRILNGLTIASLYFPVYLFCRGL